MDPIDNARRSLEALRRQLADKLAKNHETGRAQDPPALPSGTSKPGLTPTLRQNVARKVKGLSRSDPNYEDKAIGIFVESVLLNEFGEGLIHNPEFREIMQNVQQSMRSDAHLRAEFQALMKTLESEPNA